MPRSGSDQITEVQTVTDFTKKYDLYLVAECVQETVALRRVAAAGGGVAAPLQSRFASDIMPKRH